MNMILNSEVTTTLIKFITNINFHCGKLMTVFFKMLRVRVIMSNCCATIIILIIIVKYH